MNKEQRDKFMADNVNDFVPVVMGAAEAVLISQIGEKIYKEGSLMEKIQSFAANKNRGSLYEEIKTASIFATGNKIQEMLPDADFETLTYLACGISIAIINKGAVKGAQQFMMQALKDGGLEKLVDEMKNQDEIKNQENSSEADAWKTPKRS